MDIKPTPLTVSQLLNSGKEQLVVPPYQRRYSWQKKQIVQLFDDLTNLNDGETHYLGSIVCLTENHTAGVNPLELVDGQQRMTTLILILDTIKDKYEELKDEREANRLEDLVTCRDTGGKPIAKIVLGDLDNADFEIIINQTNLEKVKNKKLLEAYQNIRELLDSMSLEQLNGFKDTLINNTNIIRLDVSRAKDAFKLFETINNRGLSLSPTDIIKNFLLGHASLIDDKTLEIVKAEWTKTIINMDGQNLDDFFRQYLSGTLGKKVSFNFLTDFFKKYYIQQVEGTDILPEYKEFDDTEIGTEVKSPGTVSPTDFIAEIQEASSVYANILNRSFQDSKINDRLYSLQRIKSFPSYTFVLNLLRRDIPRNDKLDILKVIEIFMMRRNVCEYRTSELDDFFSRLATYPDENLLESVKAYLAEHLPSDREFTEMMVKHGFHGQNLDRAKCILEAIEENMTGNTAEKRINGGEDVHLEHIIPQTITTKKSKLEYGDWESYLGEDSRERHLNFVSKIGNMTLLAGKKNIAASNNPFAAKKEIYKESDICLTKEVAKCDDFRFDDVSARSEQLAILSTDIWKF